jgi:filamentous hemagglutinin family protein
MNMKNIIVLILLLTSSCQKEPDIRFGFDADFGKNSHGLTIMNVVKNTQTISLKGNIAVTDGEILVELINPDGDIVFVQNLKSPESLDVNESFPAVEGNWKLKYASIEGVGSVTLHLSPYK